MPEPRPESAPPDWRPSIAARLTPLALAPAREREIVDELAQHLDDAYRELRNDGVPHDEAVRRALQELDSRDHLAREMRPLRQASAPPPTPAGLATSGPLAGLGHDLRYAVRTLAAARGWTLVVLVLLALGIGANTAIFSATDALLLRPLPVHDPASLVRLGWTGNNDMLTEHDEYGSRQTRNGQRVRSSFSYDGYRAFAQAASGRADLIAMAPVGSVGLVIDGQAELADALEASGNYFSLLGIQPRAGRLLGPEDDRADAAPVAVIGAQYWQSRFGGDPAAIGKTIKINEVPVTIVGIVPSSFSGVQTTLAKVPDIVLPLELDRQVHASTSPNDPALITSPTAWWVEIMARLRPGTSAPQLDSVLSAAFLHSARADMDAYLRSLSEEDRKNSTNRDRHDVPTLLVDRGSRGVYDAEQNAAQSATVLSAVVAIILLIICANVANLMLSRATARHKEISVRLSLGATRGRLVRQLLTEALLLSGVGAALGVLVAYWGVRLLPPPVSTITVLHPRVLLFAAGVALVTTAVFGLLPALRATRVDVNTALKASGRGVVSRRGLLARSLLVIQVALSLVLLVGAGLFLRTLGNLRRVDVGFDPNNLMLVQITPRLSGYNLPRANVLYGDLLRRFSTIPGVRAASLSQPALLSGSVSSTSIFVQGRTYAPSTRGPSSEDMINRLVVSPEFFGVMGMTLIRGRNVSERDTSTAAHVAVINEAAAAKYFRGNPLGQHFGSSPERSGDTEVVGVLRDAKYSNPREAAPPTMYVPYLQSPRGSVIFELRTTEAPSAVAGLVRRAVHDVDPNLPIVGISTQVDRIEGRFSQERLFAQAYALFGAVALLLASVGLFGLMSYNVARRTAEMGIRMALGAQRANVLAMVMRESLLLVAIGVVVGVAAALGAGRLIASMLFGLAPDDVLTVAAAVLVMTAVSAVAAYLPARRASLVDPIVALRCE